MNRVQVCRVCRSFRETLRSHRSGAGRNRHTTVLDESRREWFWLVSLEAGEKLSPAHVSFIHSREPVKKMDPDLEQDIEGSSGDTGITADAPVDADIASEVRMPDTSGADKTQPHRDRDDNEASGGVVDPADIVVEQPQTESNLSFVAADDSCLLYTSPSPRDATLSRMPSSA